MKSKTIQRVSGLLFLVGFYASIIVIGQFDIDGPLVQLAVFFVCTLGLPVVWALGWTVRDIIKGR